jgi:two-component sensor histidine kinase
MNDASESLRFSLRWFLCALAVGFLAGVLLDGVAYSHWASLASTGRSGVIGMINSVVVWGGCMVGFRLLGRLPDRGSPTWMAARLSLGWLGVSALSVLAAGLVVRACLGAGAFGLATFPLLMLVSMAIGGGIGGFHLMKGQILLSRELGLAQARAQAMALRAQLSPHTLFNSLNTIAALIPEAPGAAEEAVQRLCRLLRRILTALDQEAWPLADEFDLVRDLLELERARFGERLSHRLDLEEADRARPVPPLILLPLVENSLKHGFRPKVGPCRLSVLARGGRIVVTDDGVGRSPDAAEGVGLRTVRQRLEAQGGTLRWLEVPAGCSVEVRLCP